VDATNAIEISQNEIPTKSLGSSDAEDAAEAWVLDRAKAAPVDIVVATLDQIRLIVMRDSLKMHARLKLKSFEALPLA
jgi:hypothetical protein